MQPVPTRKTIVIAPIYHRFVCVSIDLAGAQAEQREFASLPSCQRPAAGAPPQPGRCRSQMRSIEAIRDGRSACVAISRWEAHRQDRCLLVRVGGRLGQAAAALLRSQLVARSILLAAAGPRREPGAAAGPSRRPPPAHCWRRRRGCSPRQALCSWAAMLRCRSSWQSKSCSSARSAW